MFDYLSGWVDYPILEPGNRLIVLEQIRQEAIRLGLNVVTLCDRAIEELKNEIAMNQELFSVQSQKANPRLNELDPEVDHFVGRIYSSLMADAKGYYGKDRQKAAMLLLQTFFPQKLAKITQLNRANQGPVVSHLIDTIRNKYAAEMELLEITSLLDTLESKNDEYCAILKERKEIELTFQEVKIKRQEGQALFLQILVLVLGHCTQIPEENEKDIQALINPFIIQEEATRKARKTKKTKKQASVSKKETEENNTDDSEEKPEDTTEDTHTHNINLTMD